MYRRLIIFTSLLISALVLVSNERINIATAAKPTPTPNSPTIKITASNIDQLAIERRLGDDAIFASTWGNNEGLTTVRHSGIWRRLPNKAEVLLRPLNLSHLKNDHVVFNPQKTLLAIDDGEHTIYVIEVATGEQRGTFNYGEQDKSTVHRFAINPAGNLVAFMNRDGLIHLWDVPTGTERTSFQTDDMLDYQGIGALQFGPDGSVLLSGTKSIRLWNLKSGKSTTFVPDGTKQRISYDYSTAPYKFSPDGAWLAIASTQQSGLWDVKSGTLKIALNLTVGTLMEFSPDSERLVWTHKDDPQQPYKSTLTSLEIASEKTKVVATLPDSILHDMLFSPDGLTVAFVGQILFPRIDSGYGYTGVFGVFLRDMTTGRERVRMQLPEIPSYQAQLSAIGFSPNSTHLAIADNYGDSVIWDTLNGLKWYFPSQAAQGFADQLVFSPDGSTLTSMSLVRFYEFGQLWDVSTGRMRTSVYLGTSDNPIYLVSPDGKYIVTGTGVVNGVMPQAASGYNLKLGKRIFTSSFSARPRRFTSDGKGVVLFADAGDWSVYLFRFDTGEMRRLIDLRSTWDNPFPNKIPYDISSDLAFIVVKGIDRDFHLTGTVRLWDVARGRFRNDLVKSTDYKIDFSPDGTQAVISGNTNGVNASRIINLKTGKEITQVPVRPEPRFVSPDGKTRLDYTSPIPNKLHIWDVLLNKERAVLEDVKDFSYNEYGPNQFVFSPDSSLVINATGKTLLFWSLTTGKLVASYTDPQDEIASFAFNADGTVLAVGSQSGSITLWGIHPLEF